MSLYIQNHELILASGSPRRKQMLSELGIQFKVVVSNAEEIPKPGETPEAIVRRFALDKARAVASSFPDAWVLGADTDVSVDGDVLGKPSDELDARRLLSKIQGRTHEVWGAFTLINSKQGIEHTESGVSKVSIASLDPELIARYVKTGEPMDKAGAYAVQGIGSHFISSIEGSYSNVVGLDLSRVIAALKRFRVIS